MQGNGNQVVGHFDKLAFRGGAPFSRLLGPHSAVLRHSLWWACCCLRTQRLLCYCAWAFPPATCHAVQDSSHRHDQQQIMIRALNCNNELCDGLHQTLRCKQWRTLAALACSACCSDCTARETMRSKSFTAACRSVMDVIDLMRKLHAVKSAICSQHHMSQQTSSKCFLQAVFTSQAQSSTPQHQAFSR